MVENVKDIGGSGYVVEKDKAIWMNILVMNNFLPFKIFTKCKRKNDMKKNLEKYLWEFIFLAVCSGCGIKKEQKKTIEDTKEKIYRECEMLAEGYRNIYENAVKENALYELSTIQKVWIILENMDMQ